MPANPATRDVTNQSPPFEGLNLFTTDRPLREAVLREGGERAIESLTGFGARCGSIEAAEHSRLANAFPPQLKAYDRQGRRLDVVEFHPSYHALMTMSCAEGLHAKVHEHLEQGKAAPPGINVTRAAGFYMAAQMEAGHCCPITMTNACVPALQQQPDLAEEWLPRILSRTYDPAFKPAIDKAGVTVGMGMTERQGGTDVRTNTTKAVPVQGGGPGREYVLTGHKWFMSAPMSDAFLVLAQAPKGLSCFLMPRFLPDGTINALRFQRLKDKLGNRSNASSEVEFEGASAWLIGEEGRGVPVIIEMVSATRLDCAISSAGLMRRAVAEAIHHARYRTVFGKKLIDQPLMWQVLADLALDVEAATALVFRLARACDRAEDERARAWLRLMTPVTKYWVCKLAPSFVYEAMECLGGNGYVEEGMLARIYREVPVNAIWEGSGNVMALDIFRVLQREPDVAAMALEDLGAGLSDDSALATAFQQVQSILHEPRTLDLRARTLVEGLARVAAGALLRAHAPPAVADAYIATRLAGDFRQTWGQGLEKADCRAILDRAFPGDG
jgi:putative acyl-CoA dehydrogenase